MLKMLLVGETWTTITIHQKGFDQFSTVDYYESAVKFKSVIREQGWDVTHIAAHRIEQDFPRTVEEMKLYDVVVFSDIGSNSFLLPRSVFIDSKPDINRLELVRDYVKAGGGFAMIGGYMSFSGIEGKARYGRTALADLLPVDLEEFDDREEVPEGVEPVIAGKTPIDFSDLGRWPLLLGYNKTREKRGSEVLVMVDDSPLIAVSEHGGGRSCVFTSDVAPHWTTEEFLQWEGLPAMWNRLFRWVAQAD